MRSAAGWPAGSFSPTFDFDGALALGEVTADFLARLSRLEPFGVGNPEPVFRFGPCRRTGVARTFGGGHLGFAASELGAAPDPSLPLAVSAFVFDREFEMLAAVELDRFRNRPRLRLVDARPMALQNH